MSGMKPFGKPRNPSFIFHNKVPKSGSSTFNRILMILSHANNFHSDFVRAAALDPSQNKEILAHIKEVRVQRFIYFNVNFSKK